jgi:6-phosphogluconolactonase (cycloisomerase 2 family)
MIDRTGRFMVGVNYSSGSVVVLRLAADGGCAGLTTVVASAVLARPQKNEPIGPW